MKTVGIDALAEEGQASILDKVRTFSEFNENNDPRGEPSAGAIHAGFLFAGKGAVG